jgi:hypothetical protein
MAGSFGWRLVKLIGALCAGALVGALAGALLLIAVGTIPRGTGSTSAFVPSNLLFTYFIFWFTAPAALVAGLPSFYLLARCRMLNAISVSSVGILAGAGVNMLLKSGVPSGREMLTCAAIGLVSALAAFFLLPRSGTPRVDLQNAGNPLS